MFGEVGYLQPVTRREFRGRSMGVGFRVAEGRHVTPKPSTSRQLLCCSSIMFVQHIYADVVADSADRRHLLIGDVKWSDRSNPERIRAELLHKAQRTPFRNGRQAHYSLWLKNPDVQLDEIPVMGPAAVMASR